MCATISKEKANLLTTKYWVVILAFDQGYLGRCFVTLRAHKGSLGKLSNDEWNDFALIVKALEEACRRGLSSTLFNWSCLLNNAYQEKPYRPHVHWHFRPRYENVVTINGEKFEDPDFSHHYDREHKHLVGGETLAMILERIKANLSLAELKA